jgi:hypothetical protein
VLAGAVEVRVTDRRAERVGPVDPRRIDCDASRIVEIAAAHQRGHVELNVARVVDG